MRTLSFDPTTRGLAFVVLEKGSLIDWGIATLDPNTDDRLLQRAVSILTYYQPRLVVLERPDFTRRRDKAQQRIELLENAALVQQCAIAKVSRADVRRVIGKRTKQEIAEHLALQFPELAPRLPRKRKPWTSEDERMNIFDALSFAVTALSSL